MTDTWVVQAAATVVVPVVASWLAYRSAVKANTVTADGAARTKFTDDLQEEVGALRGVVGETRHEVDGLRYQVRTLTEYLNICLAIMRQNGIEPPPVPAMTRHPWEGL